jgi:hypothetical protein
MAPEPLERNDDETRFIRFVAGQCFSVSRGFHSSEWWASRGVRTTCWGKPLRPDWVRDAKAYSQTDRQATLRWLQEPLLRALRRALGVPIESNGWRVSLAPAKAPGPRRRFVELLQSLFAVLLSDSPLSAGGILCQHCELRRAAAGPFSALRCAVSGAGRGLWILALRVSYRGRDFGRSAPGVARASRGWRRWVDSPALRQADFSVALRGRYARALCAVLRALLGTNVAERLPALCPFTEVVFLGRSTTEPRPVALAYVEALGRVHYKACRRQQRRAIAALRRLRWNE